MTFHLEGLCLPPIGQCPGKLIWPELLGKKGEQAKDLIEKERPNTEAIYVPRDAVVSDDYCCNRVRIFLDCKVNGDYANAMVIVVPKIG